MKVKPMAVSSSRLRFVLPGAWVWSIIMKPRPPMVKRKLLARPSMMYCPFTRYGMKATGREWPCSSTVAPTLGGSTMTSQMMPAIYISGYVSGQSSPVYRSALTACDQKVGEQHHTEHCHGRGHRYAEAAHLDIRRHKYVKWQVVQCFDHFYLLLNYNYRKFANLQPAQAYSSLGIC